MRPKVADAIVQVRQYYLFVSMADVARRVPGVGDAKVIRILEYYRELKDRGLIEVLSAKARKPPAPKSVPALTPAPALASAPAPAPKRTTVRQSEAKGKKPSKRGRKSKKQRCADDSDDEDEYQPNYSYRKASSQQGLYGERRTARRGAAPKRYSPPPPEPARPRKKRIKIEHDAVCYACKESLAGLTESLIACSVCPRAYHVKPECSGLSEIAKGTWHCPW